MRRGGRLVRKKGSQCVKFLAENWTRTIVVRTRVWAIAHKTRTLTNTSASGCRACCSGLTKTTSWKHRNYLLKIHGPSAENAETICRKQRNHLPLAASFQLVGKALNHNRRLGRLSIISGCFHRFLLVFRLLVGILCVLFSRRSPLCLQE